MESQYRDHLEPVIRGAFAAGWHIVDEAADIAICASTKDLRNNPGSVYMDHGCGLQWHGPRTLENIARNAPYVLSPNAFLAERYWEAGIEAEIVGTPKMDDLVRIPLDPDGPVAVSFHWISFTRSPIGQRYAEALEHLASRVWLLGHGHPRAWPQIEQFWRRLGIEPVRDFSEVVRRASVYVCDHSSTIYEWAALDRPVVFMDFAGQQRMLSVSSGLRYEHHSNVGPHVTPATLTDTVEDVLRRDRYQTDRADATVALFPYLGSSVARTLEVLWTRSRN